MKPDANGTAGLFKVLLGAISGALAACCMLLLSRPRLAQPWTAAGSRGRAEKQGRTTAV